jgi:transketolase
MRTAFIEQLIIEARSNPGIFLLVGDLGFSVVEPFAQAFPDRFLNVGISEQNMAGIAAGLAMQGYCVYIYSIGNFPTLRCMEQIRYDICYHKLNVKIIAVGGGYSYGSLGASHHATEEIGMLRTIPDLVVCAPGDPVEARLVTTFSAAYPGPCYIRLGKAGEPLVHAPGGLKALELGDILCLRKDGEVAVLSTGGVLKYAVDFVNTAGLTAGIYSFPFVKPMNKVQLLDILKKYKKIITIEEHQSQCGFGSAILEQMHDFAEDGKLDRMPAVKRVAIPDKFYSIAGSQEFLRKTAGITLERDYFNIL